MADFFSAALPFVAIGVTLALLAANYQRERSSFITEGMCLGLALGAGLAGVLRMELGLAMSLGLLLGAAFGQLVPKKQKTNAGEEQDNYEEY